MKSSIVRRGVCLLGMAVLLAGCGNKRPPAVATTSPRAGGGGQRTQQVGDIPGVSPIDQEGATGADFGDSEGGPLADIRFQYDESGLTDEAKATLDHHAQWLQAHSTAKVRIEGNCDERGTVEYNLALGDRRAQAARDYLASRGVDASRLSAMSYGKERPLDTGRDEAAYAKNRRDHFNVSQ